MISIMKLFTLALDAVFVITAGIAFVLYTSSCSWLPWYEPDGMQFILILFFVAPVLMLLAVFFACIAKLKNSLFAMLFILLLVAPIIVNQSLSGFLFYFGQAMSLGVLLASFWIFIFDCKQSFNKGAFL